MSQPDRAWAVLGSRRAPKPLAYPNSARSVRREKAGTVAVVERLPKTYPIDYTAFIISPSRQKAKRSSHV